MPAKSRQAAKRIGKPLVGAGHARDFFRGLCGLATAAIARALGHAPTRGLSTRITQFRAHHDEFRRITC
jgi:hypothetical protein